MKTETEELTHEKAAYIAAVACHEKTGISPGLHLTKRGLHPRCIVFKAEGDGTVDHPIRDILNASLRKQDLEIIATVCHPQPEDQKGSFCLGFAVAIANSKMTKNEMQWRLMYTLCEVTST
jgi:hypothetical protein